MKKNKVELKKSKEEIEREEEKSGKRVSGEPDSNLSAVGGGGIAGAAAGAAIGTAVGGPLGGALGAAAGAIGGAVAADQIQDELDPKIEEAYWKEHHTERPYYKHGENYEEVYLPAYRFGWESAIHNQFADRDFEEIEPELRNRWIEECGEPREWDSVREICRDGFNRIRERRLQPR
jgi:hypothetical protein